MKHAVAAACLYEAGAVWTGRYPPITTLCGHHPRLAVAIVAAMATHFVLEVRHTRRIA